MGWGHRSAGDRSRRSCPLGGVLGWGERGIRGGEAGGQAGHGGDEGSVEVDLLRHKLRKIRAAAGHLCTCIVLNGERLCFYVEHRQPGGVRCYKCGEFTLVYFSFTGANGEALS